MAEITYNDDLRLYLMVFVCGQYIPDHTAWFYSTATSLDLQDGTIPQMIESLSHIVNSEGCDSTDKAYQGGTHS